VRKRETVREGGEDRDTGERQRRERERDERDKRERQRQKRGTDFSLLFLVFFFLHAFLTLCIPPRNFSFFFLPT